ncbi:bile acid:sodium symporter family protein [Chloroflexota bacterium]
MARWTQPMVLPLLALVMTLSATSITSREFTSLKAAPRTILISLLLNYVVLGGIILLLAKWLIDDDQLWTGYIIMAASPPAAGLVPFTYILGGDMLFSLIGMISAYLAALVIMPVTMAFFLGVDSFNPVASLLILGELVVIPIVASRILMVTGLFQRIEKWRGTVVNWSFFIVVLTIIGLNQSAFFREIDILLRIGAIAIATTFVLGYIIELLTRAMHLRRETAISVILIGVMKNGGFAGGILLTLFSERAAIPISITILFMVLWVVWLGFHFKKSK